MRPEMGHAGFSPPALGRRGLRFAAFKTLLFLMCFESVCVNIRYRLGFDYWLDFLCTFLILFHYECQGNAYVIVESCQCIFFTHYCTWPLSHLIWNEDFTLRLLTNLYGVNNPNGCYIASHRNFKWRKWKSLFFTPAWFTSSYELLKLYRQVWEAGFGAK